MTEVELPDGTVLEFPEGMSQEQIKAVMRDKFGSPEMNAGLQSLSDMTQNPSVAQTETPGMAGGLSGSALQGGLLGMGDEYLAGLSAVLGVQPDGQGGADWFDYSKPIGQRYATARDAIRAEQGQFEEQNPALALGTEIVGSLAVPGAALKRGAGLAVNAARGAAAGGAAGAAYGFGSGEGAEDRLQGAANQGALGAAIGGAAGAALPRLLGAAERRAARGQLVSAGKGAPSMDDLRNAATAAYQRADNAGVRISPEAFTEFKDATIASMREGGLHRAGALSLTPKGAALANIMDEMVPTDGRSIPFQDLEMLRRQAQGVAGDFTNKADAAMGRRVATSIDEMIDNLDASKIVGDGDPAALREAIQEARTMWGRLRGSEKIQQIIDDAASYRSGFESGIKNGFGKLLRRINSGKERGFTEAQVKAIRSIVDDGVSGQLLRQIGKLGFSLDGGSNALTSLLGMGAGAAVGGLPGALGLTIAGTGARKLGARRAGQLAQGMQGMIARGGLPEATAGPGILGRLALAAPRGQAPLTEDVQPLQALGLLGQLQ